jgi:hypothetical protein
MERLFTEKASRGEELRERIHLKAYGRGEMLVVSRALSSRPEGSQALY